MQQDRATLKALIDSYITTNGNKEITGAQLNEVLTNLNDSAFLQLDELRTALSTSYNPANPLNWNAVPSEVKAALDEAISRVEGLENAGFQTAAQTSYNLTVPTDWDGTPNELQSSTDELAARMRVFETNNASQDIAFVSNDGDDLTGERGNPLKPFATIQTAINAAPVNGIVKVLAGSYSEDINLNKAGIYLDISNCQITGSVRISSNDCYVNANNATITNGQTGAVTNNRLLSSVLNPVNNFTVQGGTWEALANQVVWFDPQVDNATLINCIFKSSTTSGTGAELGAIFQKLEGCKFDYTGTNSTLEVRDFKAEFINCEILNPNNIAIIAVQAIMIFKNTNIIAQRCVGNSSLGSQILHIVADGCLFRATGNYAIILNLKANNIQITNSKIVGGVDCIFFSDTNRVAGTTNVLQDNLYYAGSGNIFAGTFNASDAGTTEVLGGTFNKTFAGLSTVNVSSSTITVVGLQDVPE